MLPCCWDTCLPLGEDINFGTATAFVATGCRDYFCIRWFTFNDAGTPHTLPTAAGLPTPYPTHTRLLQAFTCPAHARLVFLHSTPRPLLRHTCLFRFLRLLYDWNLLPLHGALLFPHALRITHASGRFRHLDVVPFPCAVKTAGKLPHPHAHTTTTPGQVYSFI